MPTLDDLDRTQNTPNYAPRYHPIPIPGARWDDCPVYCISINDEWVGHVIGVLEALDQPDAWIGSEADVQDVREQVNELIVALMDKNGCKKMCCCDDATQVTIHRVNPDTGRPEISTDGGVTWTSDPNDPQYSVVQYPPPVTAGVSATKCDAATNGKEHIGDLISGISDNLATAISVFDFCVAIAGIILTIVISIITGGAGAPVATTVAALIWGAANAVFAAGKTAFDDYWTDAKKDKVLCALYCTIGDDGSFSDAQYNAFVAKYKTDVGTDPAAALVLNSITATGRPGLNNMCAYGNAADSDCSSCECEDDCGAWTYATPDGAPDGAFDGTITRIDDNNIQISTGTVAGDGKYYIGVKRMDGKCCTYDSFTVISGGVFAAFITNCPNDNNTDFSHLTEHGAVADACIWAFVAQCLTPTTIKLTLTGDCTE